MNIPSEYIAVLEQHYDGKYDCGIFDTKDGKYIFLKDGLPVAEFYLVQYGIQGLACFEFDYEKKLARNSRFRKRL